MQGLATADLVHGNRDMSLHFVADQTLVLAKQGQIFDVRDHSDCGPFPLPCLILCLPPRLHCYLVAFCSFGVFDEMTLSSIWPVGDFGEMIIL